MRLTVANRRGSTCGRCPRPGWEAEGAGVPAPARGRGQRRTRPAPGSVTARGWVSSGRGCAALRGRCSHRPPGTHLCFWPGLWSPGRHCGGVLPLGRKGRRSCEGEPSPGSLREPPLARRGCLEPLHQQGNECSWWLWPPAQEQQCRVGPQQMMAEPAPQDLLSSASGL